MQKRYVIHPGRGPDPHSGQMRYFGIAELIRLYELDARECIPTEDSRPRLPGDLPVLHLFPLVAGPYTFAAQALRRRA